MTSPRDSVSFGDLPKPEPRHIVRPNSTLGNRDNHLLPPIITNVRQAISAPSTPVTKHLTPVGMTTRQQAEAAHFSQPEYDEYRHSRTQSLSSPPPSPHFLKRISFDTFSNKQGPDFCLTLKTQHQGFKWTRNSRTFLCGVDENSYSEFAVDWLFETLLADNDEVVVLRVIDSSGKIPDATEDESYYQSMAEGMMTSLIKKIDDDKAVSITVELVIGKPQDVILRTIHVYSPDSLIVGTRGKGLSGFQSLLSPGSISKFCLQKSPIPVIVVRPDRKRQRSKNKRMKDPSRKSYVDILEKSVRSHK
ncbi:usp family protein [Schizosaccharomyces japonicus yFS275]|uniref:Usp family protein n=1 Tax=Schizosaccharomyces japonicus (strain yFS275 / FY16936) TaxID=402676 RepID=B6JW81_SCHJY|nr:usp family protein [Schizosaccharomyces japonicus yFS275]EEB05632.1 usp family protein [Schizosaccharomyces japonicus yFS275]